MFVLMLLITVAKQCQSHDLLYKEECIPFSCFYYMHKFKRVIEELRISFFRPSTSLVQQNTADQLTVKFQFHDDFYNGTFFRDNNISCIQSRLIQTDISHQSLGELNIPITSTSSEDIIEWVFHLTPKDILGESVYEDKIFNYGFFAYEYHIYNHTIGWLYFTVRFEPYIYDEQPVQIFYRYSLAFVNQQDDFIKQIKFADSLSLEGCKSAKQNTTIYLGQQLFVCLLLQEADYPSYKSYFVGTNLIHQNNFIDMKFYNHFLLFVIQAEFLYLNLTLLVNVYDKEQVYSVNASFGCILMNSDSTSCPNEAELAKFRPKFNAENKTYTDYEEVDASTDTFIIYGICIGVVIWIFAVTKLYIYYDNRTIIQDKNQIDFDEDEDDDEDETVD